MVLYVEAGQKFLLDGHSGDSYLIYNPNTSKLELYIDGVIRGAWG